MAAHHQEYSCHRKKKNAVQNPVILAAPQQELINALQKKNCMYKIKCSYCDAVYISETSRTIGSRIKEHIRMVKQTVHSHLINHNKPSMQDISWEILHRNIHDIRTRKIIEALEIGKHENVMNGCIGRTLNLD